MTALEGLRVLDLTRLLPGAVATQLLRDFGAEVIKIEPPGTGDYARSLLSESGMSPIFEATNRGKKSVVIDLKSPAGRDALLRLAGSADILIEGFRPGVMESLGLGESVLRARNPRLIVASLTGYGQTGPCRDLAGHDLNYLSMAGVLDLIGAKDGPPVIPGIQIADLAGGAMQAVIGILLALAARERTGEGQYVDVSMTDGVAAMLALPLAMGAKSKRGDDVLSGRFACYNVYCCADGRWVSVGALETKFWANLCRALGREEFIADQFSGEPRQSELKAALVDCFRAQTAEHWFVALGTQDCCVTPVRTPAEAAHAIGAMPKLSATPARRVGPAPKLGEHTGEILVDSAPCGITLRLKISDVTPATATPGKRELIVRTPDGKSRTVPLEEESVALGRAATNILCYPDDVGLSRQHLIIEKLGDGWSLRDLNSKNGTFVQGNRITAPYKLHPGDRISAGHLTIEFIEMSMSPGAPAPNTVVFVDSAVVAAATTTVATSLEGLMGPSQDDFAKTRVFTGNPQMRALIRAGRELASHRDLKDLFNVIMDLSLEAVGAGRGVLMTIEGDQLQVRAARGQGFQISSAVRDRVIKEGRSVLVLDAQSDQAFRERQSIVAQNVRSMLAVPLQAQDRVIGLIYLDSPNLIRPFTPEDLNLLTVMANTAAIRIEHARLAEVEAQERMLAKDLDQAAKIQRGLLPAFAPEVPGYDLAGHTAPCRTVGGDYYDFLTYPDGRFAMLVGDVAGKGMPASLMMSSLQARVQVLFETPDELAHNVARLNKAVASNCPDNRFITFFICIIDPVKGEVQYCNAGHNPPLIVRKNGTVDRLTEGGIILGIMAKFAYKQGTARIEPGDTLVLYSDGVTEAMQADIDEEFGEDRLATVVKQSRAVNTNELVPEILTAVQKFTSGAPPADDITIVLARRL